MTEQDIRGNVQALVGAVASDRGLDDKEKVIVESLSSLVSTMLVDLHRIADALEAIASVNSERFTRELHG